jgi:hypothetical protein
MKDTIVNRFFSRLSINSKTNCFEWIGCKDKNGYGKIFYNKKHWRSHRLIYFLIHKKLNQSDLVCHRCDNPSCCNVDHLFIGTPKTNMADKVIKGRLRNQWSDKNHCKYGHEFTKENTIYKIGRTGAYIRFCKTCYTQRYKAYNLKISLEGRKRKR